VRTRKDNVLLTSKYWQLQSGCNHSTAYVDQWKGWESRQLLTQSPHAALRTGNAHQDRKKSEKVCWSHEKSQVWPRTLFMPSSGPSKRPKKLRNCHCGLQRLCVTP